MSRVTLAFIVLLAGLTALGLAIDRDEAVAANPDVSAYQALLDDYLSVVSKLGEPRVTRFDYLRLHGSKDRSKRLSAVRKQLLGKPPPPGPERLAWAINAYNFTVIEAVTENLFGAGKKQSPEPKKSVMEIRIGGHPFFEAPRVEVEGRSYTLNQFERRFVFLDFDRNGGGSPPGGLDPRAHFALVCAAKGCPPLWPTAYRADSLDAQLEAVTREALKSPDHLRWDSTRDRLEASAVFDWYAGDFGKLQDVLVFIRRYAPAKVADALAENKVQTIAAFIPWDWALNQTPGHGSSP